MIPNVDQLKQIAGNSAPNAAVLSNMVSIVVALQRTAPAVGLDKPHRVAQYLGQLGEESGEFKWDKELASGAEYEGRKDLGNVKPGDGVRFKGRTAGQITGRANYRAFTAWARKNVDNNAPDFEASPDLLNTDPWEGLGPIWYWDTHKLNAFADQGDIETITKRWNGGLNGFQVRVDNYVRAALVFLGYNAKDVSGFQIKAGLNVDGDAGPKTRAALHMALVALDTGAPVQTVAAPVVSEVQVEVKAPGKGVADAATGAGVGSATLGGALQTLQNQLTPYSMAGGWIGKLVVGLIILGAVLTVGGLAYRWWASRQKAKTITALNATPTVSK